jgi:hypothetical protein
LMPANLVDPTRPQRLLMDTIPHVHAADLMERLIA